MTVIYLCASSGGASSLSGICQSVFQFAFLHKAARERSYETCSDVPLNRSKFILGWCMSHRGDCDRARTKWMRFRSPITSFLLVNSNILSKLRSPNSAASILSQFYEARVLRLFSLMFLMLPIKSELWMLSGVNLWKVLLTPRFHLYSQMITLIQIDTSIYLRCRGPNFPFN